MRILRWTILTMMLSALAPATAIHAAQAPKTPKERLSYSMGMDAAKTLQQRKVDLDLEMLIKGMRDGFSNGKALMTDDEIRATLLAFQKELQQKATQEAKALADKNKTAGDAFLAANKKKNGVIALPSGLQYEIITKGTGKKPTMADTVSVHYTGKTIDGTVFDSSLKKGTPMDLPLKGIIPGWREALQLMPVGSKWRIFIPPALAYKDRQMGPLPPNSVLIFEVELLGIK